MKEIASAEVSYRWRLLMRQPSSSIVLSGHPDGSKEHLSG